MHNSPVTMHSSMCIVRFLMCLALLCPATKTVAQKKEISQARTFLKNRTKNYEKAEQLMTTLLKDSVNTGNKQIYEIWLEAVKGQYDQANERMYLKQKQDTTAFFALTMRMFDIARQLDSLEAIPDSKGRIKLANRHKNATMLNPYRQNLMSAGLFFIRKSKWDDAYKYLDTYIECADMPLFSSYNYNANDKRMPEAAYWATYSAYKAKNPANTLKHTLTALRDTARTDYVLEFAAEAYRQQNDNGSYIATLEKGFNRNPMFGYFFPRLIDAYTQQGDTEKALQLADMALEVCDSCELFIFAKSSTLLRMERWQESVKYSERLIHQNDSMPEPYFNASIAFLNMAETPEVKEDKPRLTTYYQKARTYMEYYRRLMPDEKDKWAPALYRIYLNLNLGRQFDEIDKILKSK